MIDACPACRGTSLRDFHEQLNIPVNSCILVEDVETASSFPTGDLLLSICETCGFYFNRLFDRSKSEYSARYEETQGFSARFQEFMHDLSKQWADKYDLAGKHLLEIGCGKGEFLATICEVAGATGTGIDPSWRDDRSELEFPEGVDFIADFYGEQYSHLTGDAIICRHTLEHISPVLDFMNIVRASIEDRNPVMLWELPDGERVLRDVAFEDVYYEHCSYFSRGSLARLFRASGFDPVFTELDYDDQYILIEGFPGAGDSPAVESEDDVAKMLGYADHFATEYPKKLGQWRSDLETNASGGQKTVIWGAGSKGVSYLTTLGITEEVEYAVDINPYKQHKYLAGTGQKVVGPEFMAEYRPDVVVVMNAIYVDEISKQLASLDVDATVVAV